MNLSSWIASRYLLSKRAGRFAPLLLATAVASVAIGMLALVVVMSVMRGFRAELADRLLGFSAHVTLTRGADSAELSKMEAASLFAPLPLRDVAPFVQGEVIAQSGVAGDLLAQGARVRGVEPDELGAMRRVDYYFPEGSEGFASLSSHLGKGRTFPGAIIGGEIVTQLSVHPDFGDVLTLIAPLAEVLPSGELGPNKRMVDVAGIFHTGIFEYDSKYIIVSLEEAGRLLGQQAEGGWFIRLDDPDRVDEAIALAKGRLPEGWRVIGWNEQNRKLFSALRLERIAMGGVLLMVLLIASFSIVGVVLLVTAAKRKDIAILQSLGMTPRAIGRVFILYAAFIGAAGSSIGLAGGMALCLALQRWPVRLPASYYLDWLPVEVAPLLAVLFALAGVAIAVAAAVIPVRQAMRLDPVEVIRYE